MEGNIFGAQKGIGLFGFKRQEFTGRRGNAVVCTFDNLLLLL
jgi:hypothetical protein